MSSAAPSAGPPSIFMSTLRRSLVTGRLYLIIGIGFSSFFTVVLALASGPGFVFEVPLILPLFVVTGSMGALTVFTNDRLKGVLEYLIAYGVSPSRLFATFLAASLVLVSIILGVTLTVGLGVYVAVGDPLTVELARSIGLYTLPMSFAAVAFVSTMGMFWTSLSTPRSGMNSPIGLAPLIGVAPTLFVLILAEAAPNEFFYYITGGAAAALLTLVLVMVAFSGRFLRLERFLSPM